MAESNTPQCLLSKGDTMKRVRYLAGAAGLAPAALGLAVPSAANAATTGTAVGTGKTVSLQAAAGCTGHTEFYLAQAGPVRGHGWYTDNGGNVCIGTVVVSVYTSQAGNDGPALFVEGANRSSYFSATQVAGVVGKWEHHSFGVHRLFRRTACATASSYFQHSAGTGKCF
jgi:hypothetical protein